ncbi:hypothetical protein [Pigmentiphaga litoralis]|uniref:hypothetical protein n=1 Tax=Pigmentiphaga litoralis TaxID=516702 RepID=UPI003B43CB28
MTKETNAPHNPHRSYDNPTESVDQQDAFPESKGTTGGRPGSQQPDSEKATQYNGSTEADPREDAPDLFSPQDDSPSVLKEKDGGLIKSSGRTL